MSRVARLQRLACGAAVFAAPFAFGIQAQAADFGYYDPPPAVQRPYAPPPVVEYERRTYVAPQVEVVPRHRHVELDADGCRVTVRRYDDAYGREVTRRTRDCGERDYSAVAPRPGYPHDRYIPYDNPRPVVPDADDFD